MTIKWFKSPLIWIIFPLTQPQVANQQKRLKKSELSCYKTCVSVGKLNLVSFLWRELNLKSPNKLYFVWTSLFLPIFSTHPSVLTFRTCLACTVCLMWKIFFNIKTDHFFISRLIIGFKRQTFIPTITGSILKWWNGMLRHAFSRVGEDISLQHILLPLCN